MQDTDLGMSDNSPGGLHFPTLRWGERGRGGKGGGRGRIGGKKDRKKKRRDRKKKREDVLAHSPPLSSEADSM